MNSTDSTAPVIALTVTSSMENIKSDSTALLVTIIQLSYGVPSTILMIFFFFFLGFGKKYSNSFYRLVQLDILVNLLCYINSWFAIRINKHPAALPFLKALTVVFPTALTWTRYFAYFFMHMQVVCAVALSLHRVSSVFFYTQYEKFWNRGFIFFCLLCIFYSCVCVSPIPGFITEVYILNGTLTQTNYLRVIAKAMDITAYFSAIYFVLLLVVGITTSRLVTMKIQAASLTNGGIGKKLTKIAVTYGSIYSGILLWSVINALNSNFKYLPDDIAQFCAKSLPFASDMMTLALPYILMVYDTNVKQDIFKTQPISISNSRIISSSFVITRQ